MSVRNIGYCCINLELQQQGIFTNRTTRKNTFNSINGLNVVSKLSLQNCSDLEKILNWNVQNNIKQFRISSALFPWMSEYNFCQLKDYPEIKDILIRCGKIVKDSSMRVGFHPGHFTVLASMNQNVVNRSIDDLIKHSEILDLMELDSNQYYGLNIHINITKPSKIDSIYRFIEIFNKLPIDTKNRITLENDDSPNQYGVEDLYIVYERVGVPILLDFMHYEFGPDPNKKIYDMMTLAFSTWGNQIPLTHFSSTKLWEDKSAKKIAHADFLYEKIPDHDITFDCELENKSKEKGLLAYNENNLPDLDILNENRFLSK